jgi:exodeoxyribonuclease V beta subunit
VTLSPDCSLVLEASAGTGKTYTIERLLIRALLEDAPGLQRPLTLQEILLVTFTKAAVQELKDRIRLLLVEEIGSSSRQEKEKRLLKHALTEFDTAPIYTIHGFCYKVLQEQAFESGVSLQRPIDEESMSDTVLKAIIETVFREEKLQESFTVQQIDLLLKRNRYDLSGLVRELLSAMKEGTPCETSWSNEACYEQFLSSFSQFKGVDLHALKTVYNKTGEWDDQALDLLSSGCTDRSFFEENARGMLEQLEYFSPAFLSKKKNVMLPQVASDMNQKLLPCLRRYAGYPYQFLRLLDMCQKRLEKEVALKGPLTFDSAIALMIDLLGKNERALKRLKATYQLVIIDEFQDTDPSQWALFKRIFLDEQHRMILVGDPKQSIYGFRGADIYTYIDAVKSLGEEAKRQLSVNYRSIPPLVRALNALFQMTPAWITLPFHDSYLPYVPVEAGVADSKVDGKALQVLLVKSTEKKMAPIEERWFFPYFAKEAIRLKEEESFEWNKIAFLVRDHAQAHRLHGYLTASGIPASVQKTPDMIESRAYAELLDIVEAIHRPRDARMVKKALCGMLFGWSAAQLVKADCSEAYLQELAYFIRAHERCDEEGIAVVLYELLQNARTRLLTKENGAAYFEEALQLLEKVIAANAKRPEECLKTLLKLEKEKFLEKRSGEGVQIVTLFYSKGLEYDVVFVPGIYQRSPIDTELVKLKTHQGQILTPLYADDPRYDAYLEESDAEKARQFYVALTRAKCRLYLPVIFGLNAPSKGKASALELFMAKCEDPNADWHGQYALMKEGAYPQFIENLSKHPEIAVQELEEGSKPFYDARLQTQALIAPEEACRIYPPLFHYSFTSLSRLHEKIHSHEGRIAAVGLPAGKDTGILLHLLLEKAPWRLVQAARDHHDFLPYVSKHVDHTVYETHKEEIAKVLFTAFSTPLSPLGFALREVSAAKMMREMEFQMAAEVGKEIPELQSAHGIVKGVLDLFFEHKGLYYLVDWKSNCLAGYAHENMKDEMLLRHYFLQEQIYRSALKQYLQLVEKRPFDECYGGSFYLFLRGLTKTEGCYYHA